MFSHPDYDGHEALLFTQDAASGLRALIAIHDTTLGPAFGGCRMNPYASEQHAMTDVLRLSRGMTYKAAICELPFGGGKSVIIADPRRDKTPALLHAMGRIEQPRKVQVMKVGLFINTQFPEGFDLAGRVPEIIAQVRAARDAGFVSLWGLRRRLPRLGSGMGSCFRLNPCTLQSGYWLVGIVDWPDRAGLPGAARSEER